MRNGLRRKKTAWNHTAKVPHLLHELAAAVSVVVNVLVHHQVAARTVNEQGRVDLIGGGSAVVAGLRHALELERDVSQRSCVKRASLCEKSNITFFVISAICSLHWVFLRFRRCVVLFFNQRNCDQATVVTHKFTVNSTTRPNILPFWQSTWQVVWVTEEKEPVVAPGPQTRRGVRGPFPPNFFCA